MTILCEHHESADCLTLVDGEIDVEEGELTYVELRYQCAHYPTLEGVYRCAGDVETVDGALVRVESRGTPLDEQRPVGGEGQ
ncbi:hypothetical protein [Halomontanus rarus]|uniref:hypothetical protein n=1 Tax=Halomontanus rarus TaxID=3034020 RepID=UPI0023E88AD5|nr:hypothetical protein [Halovivax sp. TS33]